MGIRFDHVYNLYGYNLLTNMKIECLNETKFKKDNQTIILEVNITNCIIEFSGVEGVYYEENRDYVRLVIANIAVYFIYLNENRIEVNSISENYVVSTLFNLPFSLFLAYRGGVLLHVSTLVYNNKLIALSGSKGAGKSTLTSVLSKKIEFFSDDTLSCISKNNELLYDAGLQYIKMNEDSFYIYNSSEKSFEIYNQNVQGKAYIEIDNTYGLERINEKITLNSIFILNRRNNLNELKIALIDNPIQKKVFLHSSIVGVDILGHNYQTLINDNITFNNLLKNISVFNIILPNDINYLNDNVDTIANIIIQNIGGIDER